MSQTTTINTASVQLKNLQNCLNETVSYYNNNRFIKRHHGSAVGKFEFLANQCSAIVVADSCDRLRGEDQKLADTGLNTMRAFIQSGLSESSWIKTKMDELEKMKRMKKMDENEHDAMFARANEILVIKPDHSKALYYRGRARYGKGMLYLSLEDLTCSYNLNRSYKNTFFLGLLNLHLAEKTEAIKFFQECLALEPKHIANEQLLNIIEDLKK
jgi:tetratricopeptide (TPR) repeat protein